MKKLHVATCVFVLIGLAGLSTTAVADDAEPLINADQSETVSAESEPQLSEKEKRKLLRREARQLDEIVVTAQKREENIRDVPLSVSALDGEMIRDSNIEDANDLAKMTPNVRIMVRPVSNYISVRGLGTDENAGFEQSVGLIIDGVYYGRANFLNDAFIDIERFEVLRGPQGTLFGKNTIAGALNIVTGVPKFDWEAQLDLMMGEYEHKRARAVLNVPVIEDMLAFRLAGAYEERDGYMFNSTVGATESNLDKQNYRTKVGFSLGPVDVTLTGSYSEVYQDGVGFQLSAATDELLAFYGLFDSEIEADLDFHSSMDQPSNGYVETAMFSGDFSFDVAEHRVHIIGGWTEMKSGQNIDADFGPVPMFVLSRDDVYEQGSLELRAESPEGPLEYTVGLFYLTSTLNAQGNIFIFPIDKFGNDFVSLLTPDVVEGLFSPLVASLIPQANAETEQKDFDQWQDSVAAFGQLNWNINDRWTVIGGLRFSYEKKSVDVVQELNGVGGVAPVILFPAALGAEAYDAKLERTEFDFSPKLALKVDVTDDIMTYATYARGFKGGGFNEASFTEEQLEFDAEVADTLELGSKMRLFYGAINLNMALFYTRFDNLQVSLFNGTEFVVGNAAEAETYGLEWDMLFAASEHLFFTLNGGYTHATYASFVDGPCPDDQLGDSDPSCDLTGRSLARAPRWTGNFGINYLLPLGNLPFGAFMMTDVLYQGETYLTTDLDPIDRQDAYIQWNAGLGIRDLDGTWQFTVYGRNLTDKLVRLEGSDVALFTGSHWAMIDQGRTIRAEFRLSL